MPIHRPEDRCSANQSAVANQAVRISWQLFNQKFWFKIKQTVCYTPTLKLKAVSVRTEHVRLGDFCLRTKPFCLNSINVERLLSI